LSTRALSSWASSLSTLTQSWITSECSDHVHDLLLISLSVEPKGASSRLQAMRTPLQ
jgi:hypothetical protein